MSDESALRFGADFGPTDFCAAPPGGSTPERARDMAIVHAPEAGESALELDLIALPKYDVSKPTEAGVPPEPIDLGRGVQIVHLDRDEAERILTACAPRGHYFVPVRQFGQAYTFEWEVPEESWKAHPYSWDPERELQTALSMSRLVLDNGYSLQYAARVMDYDNGEQQVVPVRTQTNVWRIRTGRDWMTYPEAEALKDLLHAYWEVQEDLPGRVARALWLADYAVGVGSLQVRLPLLVVALEAFTNTSETKVTRQFCHRVPVMASEAGVDGVDRRLCDWAYDVRSRWAHGEEVRLVPPKSRQIQAGEEDPSHSKSEEEAEAVARADLIQRALRAIVRKALEDSEFRVAFSDDGLLRSRWPVSARIVDDNGVAQEVQL